MLAEFMLALMLSAFLFSILCALYLAAEKNISAQAAYRALQENGRLASQVLIRNIHRAGNIGCARLTRDFPLTNDVDDALLPDNKIRGTNDTLTIRGGSRESGYLLQPMVTPSILYASKELHYSPGDSVMISDCQTAEIFRVKSVEIVNRLTQRLATRTPLHKKYSQNAELRYFETNSYFTLATKRVDSAGVPITALYLKNNKNHSAELVEGIDSIHFTYDVMRQNQRVTVAADQVQNWADVVGVGAMLSLRAVNGYPLQKIEHVYARVYG